MIKFDEIITKEYAGGINGYGVKHGSQTVVFIKTGRGGRVCGENDRSDLYAGLANEINVRFGYSVVVSDNPADETRDNPLDDEINFITAYFKRTADITVLYIGYSAGANYGAWYAHRYAVIRDMLLINPVLNFNLHKMQECCERFSGTIEFAIGENDPSARWTGLIGENRNIKIKRLCGQGHRIESGMLIDTVLEFMEGLRSN